MSHLQLVIDNTKPVLSDYFESRKLVWALESVIDELCDNFDRVAESYSFEKLEWLLTELGSLYAQEKLSPSCV